MDLAAWFQELRRRRVIRALLGWGLLSFAILQVIEPLQHALGLGEWFLKAVVAALAVGFPLTAGLAWVFDLKRSGIERTAPMGSEEGTPAQASIAAPVILVFAGALLGAGVAGLAGWHLWGRTPAPGPDGRITVAVADFVNDTREADLDGLSAQLITSLEQSQRLRVLTRSRMVDVLRQLGKPSVPVVDEVLGREMALAAGVRALVVASIRRFDELYVIDLKVLDPQTSEYFFTLKEERAGKVAIPAMIDRLSEKARERLKETPAEVRTARIAVGDSITRNYEALQHYFAGLKLEDGFRYRAAVAEYRKAAAADPQFALAHYRIAYLGEFATLDLSEIKTALDAAFRQIDLVPAKERLLFQAWKAHVEHRQEEAHAIYARAADAFPQDKQVQYLAGDLYLHEGTSDEAIPWFERAVALDPVWPEAQEHLIEALRMSGRHVEAVARARRWADQAPGTGSRLELALSLRSAGKVEEALEVNRRVVAEDPSWFATSRLAIALLMADRFEEAEQIIRPHAVQGAEDRIESVVLLLSILTYQGRLREALRIHDAHAKLPGAPYWFGPGMRWNVLSAGRERAAALRAADAVEASAARLGEDSSLVFWRLEVGDVRSAAREVPAAGTASRKLYEAIATARRGDPEAALEAIRALVREHPGRVPYTWWRATIAFDSGRDAEGIAATDEFDRAFWIIPWRAGAVGRLLHRKALAQERLGDRAGAAATVERLVARWRKADPDFPLVADSQAMCRRLRCNEPPVVARR
jgi:eukaryotic-like serine/threonine-protein kinase